MIHKKLQASFIHLFISTLVVSSFLFFVLTVWYPTPLFEISGLQKIILILVSIDLILGPLLTLVVYKPQKKTLKFDLSVIAAVQIAALSYGAYTIYQAHPLYIVFATDRFTTINANETNPDFAKYDEFQKSRLAGPVLAYSQLPSDPAERSRLVLEFMRGQPDIDARPEFYEPLDKHQQNMFTKSIPIAKLATSPEHKIKFDDFLNKYGGSPHDYAFFPLDGREKSVIWVWKRESKKPVGMLDTNPWSLENLNTAHKE